MVGSKTAIVVDDMRTMRGIIDSFLSKNGFSVTQCESAADFYKTLHGLTPDVILLDVEMPEEDGYQICDWIRNALGYRDVPVLFVTANNTKKDMARAKDVGGDYFVKKPFDEATLVNGVERAIEIRRAKNGQGPPVKIESSKTAIVVDDMKLMRDLTSRMLDTAGYTVMKCDSDKQLYKMLHTVTPSVILLDVNMPGDNGYKICDYIRNNMTHIDCPIVFITGNKSKKDIELAKSSGGDYFIVKPFDENTLLHGVRRGFQIRRDSRNQNHFI